MTALQMEKELLTRWKKLPLDKRQETLDFVQFLEAKISGSAKSLESSLGLCADLNLSINSEEIDEARREMWSQFPREDF